MPARRACRRRGRRRPVSASRSRRRRVVVTSRTISSACLPGDDARRSASPAVGRVEEQGHDLVHPIAVERAEVHARRDADRGATPKCAATGGCQRGRGAPAVLGARRVPEHLLGEAESAAPVAGDPARGPGSARCGRRAPYSHAVDAGAAHDGDGGRGIRAGPQHRERVVVDDDVSRSSPARRSRRRSRSSSGRSAFGQIAGDERRPVRRRMPRRAPLRRRRRAIATAAGAPTMCGTEGAAARAGERRCRPRRRAATSVLLLPPSRASRQGVGQRAHGSHSRFSAMQQCRPAPRRGSSCADERVGQQRAQRRGRGRRGRRLDAELLVAGDVRDEAGRERRDGGDGVHARARRRPTLARDLDDASSSRNGSVPALRTFTTWSRAGRRAEQARRAGRSRPRSRTRRRAAPSCCRLLASAGSAYSASSSPRCGHTAGARRRGARAARRARRAA